jgi:carotenoid cleavage dioxygenase
VKYDLEKGNSQFHNLNGGQGSEPVFVKDPAGSSEDDGWVLSYVHQPATNTSEIVIVDSRSFEKEPIARIHIPARVPAGFHGNWVPDGY